MLVWAESMDMAAFRTYGSESISKVMKSTGQLSKLKNAGRR